MKKQFISPIITKNAVCLFVSSTAYETRYAVAYFTTQAKEENLLVNVAHFYAFEPIKIDFTIVFDGKATQKLMLLLGKDKMGFLKALWKRFSGFSAQDDLLDFAAQEGIAFEVEDTLEKNDQGFRYKFNDVYIGDRQLYDRYGNYIVPKLYNPPQNGVVKIYTKDNFLLYEFPYKNGKMNGLAKCYFENSKVLSWTQTYIDGKLDGKTCHFFRKGTLNKTETFVKGVKQGPACLYNMKGYLEEEIMWAKNKKNGPAKKFYPNGQVEHEAAFINDLQEGSTRMYYESGKLKYEGTYKKGKCWGVGIGYYENTKKEYITPYKNGKIDGVDVYYYKNGCVEWKIPYKRGLEEGKVRQYYENGNLKQETLFRKGKKEGTMKGFYSDGTLKLETHYVHGKKQGVSQTFYDNGKLRTQLRYKGDKLNGAYIKYYKDGGITYEYNYKNGLREGYSSAYHEKTGKIRYKFWFRKGLLVDPYGNEGIVGVKEVNAEKKHDRAEHPHLI